MEVKHIKDLLRDHAFFQSMREEHLMFLAGCGRNVHYDRHGVIFRDNTPANAFYILREGRVAIDIEAPGRSPLTIATLDEGEVFGWSWIFPPYVWHFTARAVEPVRAVQMDGKCLRGKIEGDTELGYDLMKRFCSVMLERLDRTQMQLLDVYGHTRGGD